MEYLDQLKPIEQAKYVSQRVSKKLVSRRQPRKTHKQLAKEMGRCRSSISQLAGIYRLEVMVKDLIRKGALTKTHGRALSALPLHQQRYYAEQVVSHHLSTRALVQLIKNENRSAIKASFDGTHQSLQVRHQPQQPDVDMSTLEKKLSEHLGQPVKLTNNTITIGYHSLEEFDGVLQRMGLSELAG